MGVKFAKAFGARVVVFTTSPHKKEDALRLGADEVVVSTSPEEMQKHAGSFDFILDTVSADHDIKAYLALLRIDGNITLVGAPPKPLAVPAFALIMYASLICCAGITSTSAVMSCVPQKSSISCVSAISPMFEPETLRACRHPGD